LDIYKQNIIDHYKRPRNKGQIDNADYVVYEVNTLCGDALKFFVKLSEDKKTITDVKFKGEGCAISQSTASMLTEELKGCRVEELKDLISQESILEMLGVEVNPARMKCAMLASESLKKLL
jgi:nitrogen fixation protein NifU and related proteins